jgi:hypothetical protein
VCVLHEHILDPCARIVNVRLLWNIELGRALARGMFEPDGDMRTHGDFSRACSRECETSACGQATPDCNVSGRSLFMHAARSGQDAQPMLSDLLAGGM